ncbi:hypothetical protein LZ30DRAFT_105063 [Colletotrichum cereale]|nr:hypothetical protein LZ30DRAFT_105063 [Colletotrichum cereale]
MELLRPFGSERGAETAGVSWVILSQLTYTRLFVQTTYTRQTLPKVPELGSDRGQGFFPSPPAAHSRDHPSIQVHQRADRLGGGGERRVFALSVSRPPPPFYHGTPTMRLSPPRPFVCLFVPQRRTAGPSSSHPLFLSPTMSQRHLPNHRRSRSTPAIPCVLRWFLDGPWGRGY